MGFLLSVNMFHCPDEWGINMYIYIYISFSKIKSDCLEFVQPFASPRNSFLQKWVGLWVLFAWLWPTMASRSPEMSWRMGGDREVAGRSQRWHEFYDRNDRSIVCTVYYLNM